MLWKILGVIVGYVVTALLIFVGLTAAYLALGANTTFQPNSYEVTSTWLVAWFVVSLIAAIIGGLVCKLISKSSGTVMAFAGIILVLGIISGIFEMAKPAPTDARTGDVPNIEAMMKAKQPVWVAFLTPIIGAVGIMIGGRLKKD